MKTQKSDIRLAGSLVPKKPMNKETMLLQIREKVTAMASLRDMRIAQRRSFEKAQQRLGEEIDTLSQEINKLYAVFNDTVFNECRVEEGGIFDHEKQQELYLANCLPETFMVDDLIVEFEDEDGDVNVTRIPSLSSVTATLSASSSNNKTMTEGEQS
ncbi:hypothetical protein [Sansalvadorimonas verongulae]|uniref:hypothetical protein n=1 Tax=Sansalvadorimonas verongulae TaxID=2172824 RepID=UPI0012BBC1FB|nr:hypothetical protein [Sansalvadorimonas verongulae]MTI13808.1 hypothetical protein [Sansalvadorimonas verongulae]